MRKQKSPKTKQRLVTYLDNDIMQKLRIQAKERHISESVYARQIVSKEVLSNSKA